ncbi:MAG: LysM peptidoglycan-binding domain-containing protein, partial [Proteobacteria bacterium]|nr:LysM peptidoglycan-binding domain-containing protein [Pseudomonadota bacterium]
KCRNAGRKAFAPGRYVVARGDTLWRIALRHYRNGMYYIRIYRANRSTIRDPNLIYPCQTIYLPRKRG